MSSFPLTLSRDSLSLDASLMKLWFIQQQNALFTTYIIPVNVLIHRTVVTQTGHAIIMSNWAIGKQNIACFGLLRSTAT